ncbi:TRAP transporter small permease [Rubrivivax sp. JA1024]|uniref:TRAP transporter small permease n=1 Tax=Rubrivivax sp. JA1026 TaxID=2710888 RepID=UPI001E53B273|nr:TRAP transporter small permease [Rubrivivax sp. JA1026]MCD0422904.1 TRAP transporter small permease [Rubrivivax sp. JA1024]
MAFWIRRGMRVLDLACATLLALMVVLVFGNVVMRYGFDASITVSEELARWAFVWMTMLGAVVAVENRGHLGSNLLVERLGPGARRACLLLSQALMIGITAMLLVGSWQQAAINWPVRAPVSGLSMAWFYGAGVVFGVLVLGLLLRQALRTLTGAGDEELAPLQESEDVAQIQDLHLDRSAAWRH